MVHLLFERSNTFRDCFKSMGISAMSYDLEGNPDFKIDIFKNRESIFQRFIKETDLVIAFFPCTYFNQYNAMLFTCQQKQLADFDLLSKLDYSLIRTRKRQEYYETLVWMISYCVKNDIRLIIENPATANYLFNTLPIKPSIVDINRAEHGDYFVKPTAYWFLNFEPKRSEYFVEPNNEPLSIESMQAGDDNRSKISPRYAEWFICSQILGKTNPNPNKLF